MWKPNLKASPTLSTSAPEPMVLTASVALCASTDTGPRRLSIKAYSGAEMSPPGWPRTIVATSGVSHPATIPILLDHSTTINATVGSAIVSTANGEITLEATLADVPAAHTAINLLEAGVNLQASVGMRVIDYRALKDGEVVETNNRTFTAKAGQTLVESAELFETSLVPLGADANTTVSLSAKESTMSEDILTAQREEQANELQRVAAINLLSQEKPQHASLCATAIKEGTSQQALELSVLKADMSVAPTSSTPGGGGKLKADSDAMAAGLLMRLGLTAVAEKSYDEQTMHAGKSFSRMSLFDMARCDLESRGEFRHDMTKSQALQASVGYSSGNLGVGLSNSMSKAVAAMFEAYPNTWSAIAAPKSVINFKEHSAVRAVWNQGFLPNGPTGELQTGTYSEDVYNYQVACFGRTQQVSREALINDDLGLFDSIQRGMAEDGARKVSDLFWTTVLDAEGTTFFSVANDNLMTDVFGTAGLTDAFSMMRKQVDSLGNSIDMSPAVLAVPPELEFEARQLIASTELSRVSTADNAPIANPFMNTLSIQVEPRLSDTNFNSAASATAWYLFAAPSRESFVLASLNGQVSPTIETKSDIDFSTLGMGVRAYGDWGAAEATYQAALKSDGSV